MYIIFSRMFFSRVWPLIYTIMKLHMTMASNGFKMPVCCVYKRDTSSAKVSSDGLTVHPVSSDFSVQD